MIGMQTKALFVDAYRDLNARKLFWVVLGLTVLVVAAFATLGRQWQTGLSVLTWKLPEDIPAAMFLYKWIFSYIVVGRWLTWAATILALISTASIFPDFMAGGAIDLYLSKPIGRLRLFATRFVSGLLFVALQVSVFTVGSFLVLGLRAGVWEPGLFLAIPIVVVFFSYLFAICVLLGVLTRSTLAAFFLTLVAWFLIWGLNATDQFLMRIDEVYETRAESAQRRMARQDVQIADAQRRLDASTTRPANGGQAGASDSPDARRLRELKSERQRLVAAAAQTQPPAWAGTAQRIIFALNTLVPKTQETIGLLDRVLFTDTDITAMLNASPKAAPMRGWRNQISQVVHGRSLAWILGSSLAFEGLILALASWRFCRRDY